MLAGIVDYGEFWYMQTQVSMASREGARYATRYQSDPNTGNRIAPNALTPSIHDYVLNKPAENNPNKGFGLKYLLPTDANPAVPTPTGAGYTTGTSGDPVSVEVTAEKHWLFLHWLIPGLTNPQALKSTTTMACD